MSAVSAGPSPVFAYLRHPSMVDFPGHLAAVFFTSGCNFTCGFCHNASLMGRTRPGLSWDKLDVACRRFKEHWVTGAAVTGGEPTLCEGLGELIDFFKSRGLDVKVDTNGTNPKAVKILAETVDCVAMDVKASLDAYPELTGWTDTAAIRKSLKIVKGMPTGVLRTTIIESFHTDRMMRKIGALIEGIPIYQMQAFVPRADLPGVPFRTMPRTSAARLEELRELMKPYAGKIVIRGG
jgi:pyruvate formate lyase activating enzyme